MYGGGEGKAILVFQVLVELMLKPNELGRSLFFLESVAESYLRCFNSINALFFVVFIFILFSKKENIT